MTVPSNGSRARNGSLKAQISNAVVGVVREYTGRGPTKARTSIRDNLVVVLLEDTLTRGERVLVDNDRSEMVLDIRFEYQRAMREELNGHVERLTGRKVIAMMSTNHIDPDLAAELFVLDAPLDPDLLTSETTPAVTAPQ